MISESKLEKHIVDLERARDNKESALFAGRSMTTADIIKLIKILKDGKDLLFPKGKFKSLRKWNFRRIWKAACLFFDIMAIL